MSALPTLLLVEDDPGLQQALLQGLSLHGYNVTVASDGADAARLALDRRFDVAVLDLMLPSFDGYTLARKMRAHWGQAAPPLIFTSGLNRPTEDEEEMRERYGAIGFLTKPFELGALLHLLERSRHGLADSLAVAEVTQVEESTRRLSGLRTFRGNFAQQPFPEVLAEIHRWRASGALLVHRERAKKIVYLREGIASLVKSNLLSECLGRVLVREKLITEQECAESVARMKASDRRQGTVLVAMGCISPQNLAYGLSLQLRSKLYDVFGWSSGEFQFVPGVDAPLDPVQLGLSTASLLYEGIRRNVSAERLARFLGEVERLFPRRSPHPLDAFQGLSLTEEESTVLESMNGLRTVAELRGETPLTRADFDRLLYTLLCSQVVELLQMPVPTGGRPTHPSLPQARTLGSEGNEETLRPALLARVEQARSQDYFERLGVSRDAGSDQIEQGFLDLASAYHPDRFAHLTSVELKALAAEVYEQAVIAYEHLSDSTERERYRAALDQGVLPPISPASERLLRAELSFQEGHRQVEAGNLVQAEAHFRDAVEVYPQEAAFYAFLGWTQFQVDASRAEEAISLLERAVELNPTLDRSYLFLGRIEQARGNREQAEAHYEKALVCNPECAEALSALRLAVN